MPFLRSGRIALLAVVLLNGLAAGDVWAVAVKHAHIKAKAHSHDSLCRKLAQAPLSQAQAPLSQAPAPLAPSVVSPAPTAPVLTGKAAVVALPQAPEKIMVDAAMLSILKDLVKAARASDDAVKLDDASQKAAVKAALDALEAGILITGIGTDRICTSEQKAKLEKAMVAESWDSGLLSFAGGSHASVSVLWAKKIDGLVNVSIAGNGMCKPDSDGTSLGQYVVVLAGKSTLNSGFDIQTQSDVSFLLGKLTNISVDSTSCGAGQPHAVTTIPVLKAVLTDDQMERQAQLASLKSASKEKVQILLTRQNASGEGSQKIASEAKPAAAVQSVPNPGQGTVARETQAASPQAAGNGMAEVHPSEAAQTPAAELKPPIVLPGSTQ